MISARGRAPPWKRQQPNAATEPARVWGLSPLPSNPPPLSRVRVRVRARFRLRCPRARARARLVAPASLPAGPDRAARPLASPSAATTAHELARQRISCNDSFCAMRVGSHRSRQRGRCSGSDIDSNQRQGQQSGAGSATSGSDRGRPMLPLALPLLRGLRSPPATALEPRACGGLRAEVPGTPAVTMSLRGLRESSQSGCQAPATLAREREGTYRPGRKTSAPRVRMRTMAYIAGP